MADEKKSQIALPWYRSRIMQGLLTVVFTQVVKRVTDRYHIDLSVWGTSVSDLVSGTMDGISAFAVWWATYARLAPKVPIPPVVTLTKSSADKINAAAPQADSCKPEVPEDKQ